MQQRRLELSDLVVANVDNALEAEIIKNPFQFLSLPQDASPEDARKAYIRLAKMYHPDIVNPEAKEEIRTMAYNKMVLVNRAYQEIKSRYNPQEWNSLFGYDFETLRDESGQIVEKNVYLEGRGEVTIFTHHHEFWVAGPYLSFDYAVDEDHPWRFGYQHQINLRHLFAHLEIEEGKEVSKVLLDPFVDCFGLDHKMAEQLRMLLSSGHSTEAIMSQLGIPAENEIDRDIRVVNGIDAHLYGSRFRKQLNYITTLVGEPDFYIKGYISGMVHAQVNNEKLTLEGYTQANFSEADYMLFLTLAYGPMLK